MMVFARYVMFSEVYWHHTVRSATAMLQRLVFELADNSHPSEWLAQSDDDFGKSMINLADRHASTHLRDLAHSLFGNQRRLHKRLAQYNYSDDPEVFAALARRPYSELADISFELADCMSQQVSRPLQPTDVLIDAPPQKLEVQFRIPVRLGHAGEHRYVSLGEVSPVVNALATDQFDNYVKRVRVYIAADRISDLPAHFDVRSPLLRIAETTRDG